jgi:hypothetical protein
MKVNVMLHEGNESSRSQTQLLSGFARAVTVRRLWTGAEAKNVFLDNTVMLANIEHDPGTERTNGCTGRKAWLLSATRFDAPIN